MDAYPCHSSASASPKRSMMPSAPTARFMRKDGLSGFSASARSKQGSASGGWSQHHQRATLVRSSASAMIGLNCQRPVEIGDGVFVAAHRLHSRLPRLYQATACVVAQSPAPRRNWPAPRRMLFQRAQGIAAIAQDVGKVRLQLQRRDRNAPPLLQSAPVPAGHCPDAAAPRHCRRSSAARASSRLIASALRPCWMRSTPQQVIHLRMAGPGRLQLADQRPRPWPGRRTAGPARPAGCSAFRSIRAACAESRISESAICSFFQRIAAAMRVRPEGWS